MRLKYKIAAAICVCIFTALLGMLIRLHPSPSPACPTKGWVPDRCAPFGEFAFNNKILHIPNTPENQYKWHGELTYYPDDHRLVSPNLAFNWRTGKAAEGNTNGWPNSNIDLVRFSLQYSESDKSSVSLHALKNNLQLSSFNHAIPFPIPSGMAPYKDKFSVSANRSPAQTTIYFINPSTVLEVVQCPSLHNYFEGKARQLDNGRKNPIALNTRESSKLGHCRGLFYAQPGLLVEYHLDITQLSHIPEVQASLRSLIHSWEAHEGANRRPAY